MNSFIYFQFYVIEEKTFEVKFFNFFEDKEIKKSAIELQVIKELSPQIIFSAHEHKGMHTSLDTATDQLSEIQLFPPQEVSFYQLRLDLGDVHEIQIPTCSYRMGTKNMGYGLAYISKNHNIHNY